MFAGLRCGLRSAQLAHARTGGVVVVYDHTTDPRPEAAAWHQAIERARDRTHAANPTPGKLADLLAEAGLVQLALREEEFELDFDEWFDRGTPSKSKAEVRAMLLSGTARGFAPTPRADGGLTLRCFREMVRGSSRLDRAVLGHDQPPAILSLVCPEAQLDCQVCGQQHLFARDPGHGGQVEDEIRALADRPGQAGG
jgi:hypothetical protein